MQFTTFHKDFFGATLGAFSRVTEREYFDSQITLTDVEAETVINHFGLENINVGNVASNREMSSKRFLHYRSFTPINLNLVFPKSQKPELRLYLASSKGFKPLANEIWFIYETITKDLVIGSLPENIWNALGQEDFVDDEYQEEIESTIGSNKNIIVDPKGKIVTNIQGSRVIYVRDPKLAIMRFDKVKYRCEINESHETFISQKTKLQYMEAHHFIPMKYQQHFKTPLDNLSNIVSLCPNCHRAIHHSVIENKQELISKIYNVRAEMQNYSLDYISQFYNSIKVPHAN